MQRQHYTSPIDESALPNVYLAAAVVSLFSVFNTLGRMGFGLLSDSMPSMSRSFWIVICAVLMLLCQLSLIATNLGGLLFVVCVLGSAYGGVFGLVPTLVSEKFGNRAFGTNYGIMYCVPCRVVFLSVMLMEYLFLLSLSLSLSIFSLCRTSAPALGSLVFSTILAGGLSDVFASGTSILVRGADGELTNQVRV